MGRKPKNKTVKILDSEDKIVETEEAGIPILFQPNEWDIHEELENNEALREFQRDMEDTI